MATTGTCFAIAAQAALALENANLVESLQRSNAEMLAAERTGWSRALDLRDEETEGTVGA